MKRECGEEKKPLLVCLHCPYAGITRIRFQGLKQMLLSAGGGTPSELRENIAQFPTGVKGMKKFLLTGHCLKVYE
ncbi:hypothetical protein Dpo_10c01290 [Desulfotignum phosphitoxidans DSM 13687]|uniref:Uncharacterized protein n=1 Tax=Desulfotignum phosphitoxidans DSM 13687 TaxID=1286635 RepID=S0FTY2_9BACT|nr:hypothetical protein Dpo_10c01290 [Desulfotignum phosphitoxidans DSM 13687]